VRAHALRAKHGIHVPVVANASDIQLLREILAGMRPRPFLMYATSRICCISCLPRSLEADQPAQLFDGGAVEEVSGSQSIRIAAACERSKNQAVRSRASMASGIFFSLFSPKPSSSRTPLYRGALQIGELRKFMST
jgi:hypothetical protein